MQRRDPRLFLLDIESAVEKIFRYSSGGESEFKSSELVQDAVPRQPLVIGEAVQRLPEDLLQRSGCPCQFKMKVPMARRSEGHRSTVSCE